VHVGFYGSHQLISPSAEANVTYGFYRDLKLPIGMIPTIKVSKREIEKDKILPSATDVDVM
jgi:hypothetical protein